METPRCASLLLLCDEILTVEMQLASPVDANHTICVAVEKQAAEETLTFLLGSVSEVRRQWKT
jgi:hypothetical protein